MLTQRFLQLNLLGAEWVNWALVILSIIGFLFTIFTFAGVNFLLSGLHSYANGG